MRLSQFRFADYRLALYVVIGAVIAGGVAFGLDRAFAPTEKVQANGAPAAAVAAAQASAASSTTVRQIPIAKTSAADIGDPEGKLTPVYPAAPGKDMAVKDAPVIQAKPAVAATTGTANPAAPVAAAPAPVASAPAAATPAAAPAPAAQVATAPPLQNACNVEACAAAYRSFRESDCTYQPLVGERRYCEGAPGLGGPSSTGPVASQPPVQQRAPQSRPQYDQRNAASQPRRYEDALRDAERTVRRLPAPGRYEDDDRIVMEAPEVRYDLRRNWVSEPQED